MATYLDGHKVTMPIEFAHPMGWDSYAPNRLTKVVVHDAPRLIYPYTTAPEETSR